MSRYKLSFQKKLLLFFLLFSIIPLGSVALIVYETVRNRFEEALVTSFVREVKLQGDIIAGYLDSSRLLVQSIAAQQFLLTEVNKAVHNEPFNEDLIFLSLVAVRRENQFTERVYILDPKGQVLVSTASTDKGRSLATEEYFQKPLRNRASYVGEVFESDRNIRVFPVSTVLIRKSDNEPIGVLVAEVNVAAVNAAISDSSVNDSANVEVYVADSTSRLMTLLPRRGLGENISTPPVLLCRTENKSLSGAWVGYQGSTVLGVSRCFTYQDAQWTIVIEQPLREAREVSRELGGVILIITVVLALLLAFVTARLASSITEPIRILEREATAIGEGNFEVGVTLKTGDEFEELATEFEHARKLLKNARDREQYLGRMKSEFISIAAHQLRTPLTAMRWGLEELEKEAHDDNERMHLARTKQSAEQLIRLVNDLLNITRIEEGRFSYTFKMGDIVSVIKKASVDLAPRFSAKSLHLGIEDPKTPLPLLSFDQEKMEMAIFNVFDNAIRYTPSGGKIDVTFEARPTSITILFTDSGIGIPKDQLPNLFAKFFRAKNAILADPSGSGLGLFVIRQIIEAHGGSVDIISEEGKGTTVRLTLPVARG